MKPAPLAKLLGACLAIAHSGCSGEKVCMDQWSDNSLGTDTIQGSLVLGADSPPDTIGFDAIIDSLPELWAPSGAFLAMIDMSLTVAYPDSADASVPTVRQLPRLSIAIGIDSERQPLMFTTAPFPVGGGSWGQRLPLLSSCPVGSAPPKTCCPFGASSCSDHVTLRVERLDGAPFPPVTVEWKASASALVNRCPLASSPRLGLQESGTR